MRGSRLHTPEEVVTVRVYTRTGAVVGNGKSFTVYDATWEEVYRILDAAASLTPDGLWRLAQYAAPLEDTPDNCRRLWECFLAHAGGPVT